MQNANDMIGSLQLQYNRGRQAVITTELIDIITVRLPLVLPTCADHPGCFGFVSGSRCRRDITRKGMQYLAYEISQAGDLSSSRIAWTLTSLSTRLLSPDLRPSYSDSSSYATIRFYNYRRTSMCAELSAPPKRHDTKGRDLH